MRLDNKTLESIQYLHSNISDLVKSGYFPWMRDKYNFNQSDLATLKNHPLLNHICEVLDEIAHRKIPAKSKEKLWNALIPPLAIVQNREYIRNILAIKNYELPLYLTALKASHPFYIKQQVYNSWQPYIDVDILEAEIAAVNTWLGLLSINEKEAWMQEVIQSDATAWQNNFLFLKQDFDPIIPYNRYIDRFTRFSENLRPQMPDINAMPIFKDFIARTLDIMAEPTSSDLIFQNSSYVEKIINNLAYIEINLDLICWIIDLGKPRIFYRTERDYQNGVLRDNLETSFHLNSYNNGALFKKDYSAIINKVKDTIKLVMQKDEETFKRFLNCFIFNETGANCLDGMLFPILTFAAELESTQPKNLSSIIMDWCKTADSQLDGTEALTSAWQYCLLTILPGQMVMVETSNYSALQPFRKIVLKNYLNEILNYNITEEVIEAENILEDTKNNDVCAEASCSASTFLYPDTSLESHESGTSSMITMPVEPIIDYTNTQQSRLIKRRYMYLIMDQSVAQFDEFYALSLIEQASASDLVHLLVPDNKIIGHQFSNKIKRYGELPGNEISRDFLYLLLANRSTTVSLRFLENLKNKANITLEKILAINPLAMAAIFFRNSDFYPGDLIKNIIHIANPEHLLHLFQVKDLICYNHIATALHGLFTYYSSDLCLSACEKCICFEDFTELLLSISPLYLKSNSALMHAIVQQDQAVCLLLIKNLTEKQINCALELEPRLLSALFKHQPGFICFELIRRISASALLDTLVKKDGLALRTVLKRQEHNFIKVILNRVMSKLTTLSKKERDIFINLFLEEIGNSNCLYFLIKLEEHRIKFDITRYNIRTKNRLATFILNNHNNSEYHIVIDYLLKQINLNPDFALILIEQYFENDANLQLNNPNLDKLEEDSLHITNPLFREWLIRNINIIENKTSAVQELIQELTENLPRPDNDWLWHLSPEHRARVILHAGTGTWRNYRLLRKLRCLKTQHALMFLKQHNAVLTGMADANIIFPETTNILQPIQINFNDTSLPNSLNKIARLFQDNHAIVKISYEERWDNFLLNLTDPEHRDSLRDQLDQTYYKYDFELDHAVPYSNQYKSMQGISSERSRNGRYFLETKKTSATLIPSSLHVKVFGMRRWDNIPLVGLIFDYRSCSPAKNFFLRDYGTIKHNWVGTRLSTYSYASNLFHLKLKSRDFSTFKDMVKNSSDPSGASDPNEILVRLNTEALQAILVAQREPENNTLEYMQLSFSIALKRQLDLFHLTGKILPIIVYDYSARKLSYLPNYQVLSFQLKPTLASPITSVSEYELIYQNAMFNRDDEALSNLLKVKPVLFFEFIFEDLTLSNQDKIYLIFSNKFRDDVIYNLAYVPQQILHKMITLLQQAITVNLSTRIKDFIKHVFSKRNHPFAQEFILAMKNTLSNFNYSRELIDSYAYLFKFFIKQEHSNNDIEKLVENYLNLFAGKLDLIAELELYRRLVGYIEINQHCHKLAVEMHDSPVVRYHYTFCSQQSLETIFNEHPYEILLLLTQDKLLTMSQKLKTLDGLNQLLSIALEKEQDLPTKEHILSILLGLMRYCKAIEDHTRMAQYCELIDSHQIATTQPLIPKNQAYRYSLFVDGSNVSNKAMIHHPDF